MSGRSSLDRAKSKRQYMEAAEAACNDILTLSQEESGSLEGHILLKVYTDEIVRSLVIDLMQSGGYESRSQLNEYLSKFLDGQSFPSELRSLVKTELSSSLEKFKSQLEAMRETTKVRREGGFREVIKAYEEIDTNQAFPFELQNSYELETYPLENGNVELTANLNQPMTLDPHKLKGEFGGQITQGFPFEIDISGYTFMVDYDASYFYYGKKDEGLPGAAETLSMRLAACLIVDE